MSGSFNREEHRRAAKRPHGNRDDYWDSKRPASDSHYDGGSGGARNGYVMKLVWF